MKIVIEHTTNWSARLIQFWMGVDALLHFKKPRFTYNHAYVKINTAVWEAVGNGVVKTSQQSHLETHRPTQYKEYDVTLTTEEELIIREYLGQQEGRKYEYANFLWHVVKTLTGKWYGAKDDKKAYCYELVFNALNKLPQYSFNPYYNPRESEVIFDKTFAYKVIKVGSK